MTDVEAEIFLVKKPNVRDLIEALKRDGLLEKLDTMFHASVYDDAGNPVDVIAVARAAGYVK